jgi:hypothetical protein
MNETILNSGCDSGFGASLASTSDNGLFIGCPDYQSDMGAVYYYTRSEIGGVYHLIQKLQAVGGKAHDNFGGPDQLAVDGDLLAVGTDKEVNGTAHVFAKLKWIVSRVGNDCLDIKLHCREGTYLHHPSTTCSPSR